MRAIVDRIKRYVPPQVWQFFRKGWYRVLDFFRELGPAVRTRTYCGFTLFYDRNSSIIRRLDKEPIFEETMCVAIERSLKESAKPIFLDIGANLGLISVYTLSKVPTVAIHAFEPGGSQRALLEATIRENNLGKRIVVYPEGLSNTVGKASFSTHDPKFSSGDGLLDTGRARDAHPVMIKTTTIDSWWESAGRPIVTVVKIDTEGAELWILQGATTFLKQSSPILFLEIEPRNLKVYPYDHRDIFAFLRDHAYTLFTLGGIEITEKNFEEYLGHEDTYEARPISRA